MNIHESEQTERRALQWLMYAHKKGEGGFPHSRWMFLPSFMAWNKDYPETTGYLIENLISFNRNSVAGLDAVAKSAGEWLLHIQSAEGYFHKGTQFKEASTFNTAQILFGLDQLYDLTNEKKYLDAIGKSYHWLIDNMDKDGVFKQGLYCKNYFPIYYSRALWPLLMVDQKYFNSINNSSIDKSLNYLFNLASDPDEFYRHAGFEPGHPAFLHTIMYSLEGFFECGKLNGNKDWLKMTADQLDFLCSIIKTKNKTPGSIHSTINMDWSFVCVCGQAQLCAMLYKYHQFKPVELYYETAEFLLKQLMQWQIQSFSKETDGAFPSSIPIWKSYFPFRIVNWTSKFFLDCLYYRMNSMNHKTL